MKQFVGVGITVGVLAGIWTQVSVQLGLITWVAFVSWACFYAVGGGREGFQKGLASNLTGVVYGWLVSLLITHASFPGALAIGVGVVALFMCLQAGATLLSFIPGAFVGTAVFFGTAFKFWPTVLALVVGAVLGWASAVSGAWIQGRVTHGAPVLAEEAGAPVQAA